MRLVFTKPFIRDYQGLSESLQHRADKQLEFLLQDPHHPSLRTKKMEGKWGEQGVFEARVTRDYRFTFQIEGNQYILRRIGPHDILKTP
jgi:mRNA-degrading endonuclease YafQ of YafQ-DinJ toxin-antitoxin module